MCHRGHCDSLCAQRALRARASAAVVIVLRLSSLVLVAASTCTRGAGGRSVRTGTSLCPSIPLLRLGFVPVICVCVSGAEIAIFCVSSLVFLGFFSDFFFGLCVDRTRDPGIPRSQIRFRIGIRFDSDPARRRGRGFSPSVVAPRSVNQVFSLAEDPISASGLLAVNPIAFGTICSNMRALESCVRLVSSWMRHRSLTSETWLREPSL